VALTLLGGVATVRAAPSKAQAASLRGGWWQPSPASQRPVVQIITTGGTIASRIDPTTGAVLPAVGAEDVVASAPHR
jgi:L-asparaginase/Glu-tRNA(Gln) amidotransferase subunit D